MANRARLDAALDALERLPSKYKVAPGDDPARVLYLVINDIKKYVEETKSAVAEERGNKFEGK